MKTKELIKLLEEADPGGDTEICVGNQDIVYVDGPMPGYYDGTFIKVDYKDGEAIGATLGTTMMKIKLVTKDLEDVFLDNPDAFWDDSAGYNEKRIREFRNRIEIYRSAGRKLKKDIEAMRNNHAIKQLANQPTGTPASTNVTTPTTGEEVRHPSDRSTLASLWRLYRNKFGL